MYVCMCAWDWIQNLCLYIFKVRIVGDLKEVIDELRR